MKKNILYIVNKKYKSNEHTDSVNKISEIIIKEMELREKINLKIFKNFLGLKQILSLLKKDRKKIITLFTEFKKIYREKYDLIIYSSEAELNPFTLLIKSKNIFIYLHGAEFFSHPELRAKSRSNFDEIISRICIRLVKKKKKIKFLTVSSYAQINWSLGFKIPINKIFITYNPINNIYFQINEKKSQNFESNYFLHISNFKPQKNTKFILEVWKDFNLKYPNFKLLLVGPNNTTIDDNFKQNIINLGVVNENILIEKLLTSRALIFPSLVESFGLPIIEALSLGCPVITSNNTACTEIGTIFTTQINPYNKNELLNALIYHAENKIIFNENNSLFKKYQQQFTGASVVNKILNCYEE